MKIDFGDSELGDVPCGEIRGCRWGRWVVTGRECRGELLAFCVVVSKELVWVLNRAERKLNLFFGKIPGTKLEKRKNFGMQNNK